MPLQVVLPYPIALISAAVALYLSFQLYKRYRLKYLLYHLNYQIFTYFTHFLNAIGLTLAFSLFTLENGGGRPVPSYIFTPLISPLVALIFYFYLKFAVTWMEVTFTRWWMRVYITSWAVLLLWHAHTVFLSWQYGRNEPMTLSIWVIDTWGIMLGYLILLFMAWRSRQIKDPARRRAVRTYVMIYFSGYVFLDLITSRALAAVLGYPRGLMVNSLVFLVHLPPLAFMARFIRTYYRTASPRPVDSPDLQAFFEEHGISKRELEIIQLILAGKSNRQIEEKLYISLGTVKNHLYSIYQKLRVKNRLQLVSLVTKLGQGPSPDRRGVQT